MAAEKKGVRTQHPEYKKFCEKWKRCRDAMEGQDAVHAGGTSYLPKLKEQTDEDYNAYKRRAVWYNASWRTTAGLVGMMFRKPPEQDIPASLDDFLKNIDMQGSTFDQFGQDVATDVMEVGRIGLLVDHPAAPLKADGTSITVAEAEALGLRPMITAYEAETIINWKFRNIKNQTVPCMFVLTEQHSEPDGEFGETVETRYRVLDLQADNTYRVRVFRINEKDEDQLVSEVVPLMNGAPLVYIPFVVIGPDGVKLKCEEPPLVDLVDLNYSHYMTTADYKHGIHFSALPTFYISGYNANVDKKGVKEKIYLGSQTAILLPDPGAKADFAEVKNNFKAHRDDLDAMKQEMATLGARMLADTSTRQVETFGATAIKHVAENSILASIAISVSQGLTIALGWFAKWAGVDAEIEYDINRDFMPVQMDAPTLTALMGAWQGGALSEGELFDLLKRGDLIEPTKTLEEHQGEIDAAPPPAPTNPTAGRLGTMTPEQQATHDAKAAKKLADAVPPKKVAA